MPPNVARTLAVEAGYPQPFTMKIEKQMTAEIHTTEIERMLMERIQSTAWGSGFNAADLISPDFLHCSRYDWKANVPDLIQSSWSLLSLEARIVAFAAAAEAAYYDDPLS
jgi:hypothetical protein